jgi:hypothetical protein
MGAFDNGAQGFPTAVNVAIYKTDGTMVAGTLMNFPVGYTAGEYVGNTEFRPITPVQLNANTTYRIVAGDYWQLGVTPGSRYFDENLDTGPIQPAGNVTLGFNGAGLITLGGNYYATGTIGGPNPLTWTGTDPTTGGGPRFAAGSFDFTPVPEASQFAVAGVGLLGLVYIGRCAWQRRKSLA